jgi:hypothetical protein
MESETLVFNGTRKPGNQNQYQSRIPLVQFEGVKFGFFRNLTAPGYSPQPSTPPGKFIIKL